MRRTGKPHRVCRLVIEHVTVQLTFRECHNKCTGGQACVLPRPLPAEPVRLHTLTSSQGHIHGISAKSSSIWLNIYRVYHLLCPSHTHTNKAQTFWLSTVFYPCACRGAIKAHLTFTFNTPLSVNAALYV